MATNVKYSTRYCSDRVKQIIETSPSAIWDHLELRLYGGSIPATADAAAPTLLTTITGPADADLEFEIDPTTSAGAAVLLKSASQVWAGLVTGAGTQDATYGRLCHKDDDDTLDDVDLDWPRIQFKIGEAGFELDMSDVSQVNGATTTITYAALNVSSPS